MLDILRRSEISDSTVGFLLLFKELAGLFAWIESILLKRDNTSISFEELTLICPPAEVQAEVRRFSDMYNGLPVSGRYTESPIYEAVIRFILCHEFAHLIYFAESDGLKEKWQGIAWSDYDEALQQYIEMCNLDRRVANRLSKKALGRDIAAHWGLEFIADGMGFYLASRVARPDPAEPLRNRQILQIAVVIFFHTLLIIYRGDRGSRTHPPPLLRAMMIAARNRQVYRMNWAEFWVKAWGSGTISSILLGKVMRELKGTHDVQL
jgi:hypothetical protein